MKYKKKKLSSLLTDRKIVSSQKLAEAIILEGRIKVGDKIIDKPGTVVETDVRIEIIPKIQYVSRGGLKLEKVFSELGLNASGKKAIDIGASTGGFTDFLIKRGADKIIAIDVGYGQLSWKLRKSDRVILFERTNVRYLDARKLSFISDLTVVDVSFISIKKIFNKVLEFTSDNGEILLLVKPQFELKKEKVEKGGVIKDKRLHYEVLLDMVNFIERHPVEIKNITFSKLKGAKGNIEFWLYVIKTKVKEKINLNYDKIISGVVDDSHSYFYLNKTS